MSFTHPAMSPRKVLLPPPPKAVALAVRIEVQLGGEIREERLRRRWTLTKLAKRAGVSPSMVRGVEVGEASSLDGYVRLAVALGLEPRFTLKPEGRPPSGRDADPVHAAMGEIEAAHLKSSGYEVLLDEPYQHYQFAGRADVLALDEERRVLLHIENRTRFPDIQAFVGAYNAKRAYLPADLARRLGASGGFARVDHVVVALWSSEVLHALRLREQTFRAVCPDTLDGFEAWWSGSPGQDRGERSALVVFDPLPGRRSSRRRWVGFADMRKVDPRYRGYAEALQALRAAGLA